MALPNTGITTHLVGNTLGTSSRNVSTLCSSSLINMFSWYKPFNYNGLPSDSARDAISGLKYDSVNKQIIYDKPKGGESSPYRLGDFRGYNHNAEAPTIDEDAVGILYNTINSTININITPNWGDSRFNWGNILGGFTDSRLRLKVELYNKNKTYVASGLTGTISSIKQTGHATISVSRYGINGRDGYCYIKGYFTDVDGNVLSTFPCNGDGFIKKTIIYTQNLFIYIGNVTTDTSNCSASGSLLNGDGSESSSARLYIENKSSTNYDSNYKICWKYQWRDKDTGKSYGWFGGNIISGTESYGLPAYMSRGGIVEAGLPPRSTGKWYLDLKVYLEYRP